MRVGIVTFHHAPSYGAILQAYALSQYLRSLGHAVTVIDYMPAHRRRRMKHWRRGHRMSWRWFGLNRTNLVVRRNKSLYADAARLLLPLSRDRYASLESLQRSPPKLDVCFFGSDQIWNYESTDGKYDPAYFGGFGPKTMVRVAYAASFGRNECPRDLDHLRQYLEMLDAVSVRESSGVSIVREHANRAANVVLDPTLLIDKKHFQFVEQPIVEGPYILGYSVVGGSRFETALDKAATALAIPVVRVVDAVRSHGVNTHANPIELLNLIEYARFVVTDSFHGTALSLTFSKDFVASALEGKCANRGVRVSDLLNRLGLQNRFLKTGHDTTDFFENNSNADCWKKTLDALRQESSCFIQRSLALCRRN
ncbi:MAG: polysaccharide pyruvyl transferase family protein [Pirellulaceae bacterium]